MKKTRLEAHRFYAEILKLAEKEGAESVRAVMAELGRKDLFYLLFHLLNRKDLDNDWLYARCREVQLAPNGYLDLWAREHYKSTIITYALTIQDILNDPEVTIAIFSITRSNSKKFLSQIKDELAGNETLKELYPDVLYQTPDRESPRWSLEFGLVVKRKTNPKESTLEAHGLVQGMPTGRHFKIRIYDDVIDEENVTNPEMIKKALAAWELSLNLGSTQPCAHYEGMDLERYIGTRYHVNDPYKEIMKRNAAIPRIHPGTDNGEPDGKPVMWSPDLMATKRRKMGSYIFGCHCAGTIITMSDWSQKRIEDVVAGDVVIGFKVGDESKRTTLIKTEVVAINKRKSEAVCSTMFGGQLLYHTPDHEWWTGRTGVDTHRVYNALGDKYHKLHSLRKAISLIDSCYNANNFKNSKVNLKHQSSIGVKTVYNIQTTSGNYIADGFCSKNCQILQNPTADMVQGFKSEWIQYWTPKNWLDFNRYLLCDPAGEKKKENDYTVMLVIGLGADMNYYLIDGLRDRLNLTERARAYIRLHRMYSPTASGYEKYGKDSDIEHIEYLMDQENYRFAITPLGGQMPKNDRIRKLVPIAEEGRLFIPIHCFYIDYEKRQRNLSVEMIEDELIDFPVASHDDILDCFARIKDPDLRAIFPETLLEEDMYLRHGTKTAQTDYNIFGG